MNHTEKLISEAIKARANAYTPYSGFKVGAALLCENQKIYSGANIECAAYSVCNCAERTALFSAVYSGERKFSEIAVVGGKKEETEIFSSYCPPCGVCRQALREFCDTNEFKIILAKSVSEFKIFSLEDLLPQSFGPEHL